MPMVNVKLKQLLQIELPWLTVYQRNHVGGKRGLKLGVLVELVLYDLGIGVPLQFHRNAHAVPVGFIPDVCNPINPLFADQIPHLLHQVGLGHHIGDLRDHDGLAPVLQRLHKHPRPHPDVPSAGMVGLPHAADAVDDAPGGKVRCLDIRHQLAHIVLRVVNQGNQCIHDLSQILGRDGRSHTHRDPHRPVAQQAGKPRRQDGRLLEPFVVVRPEIHRLFVQIRKHLVAGSCHPGLGIAHGCRGIAVDGTEIALSVHKRIPHPEVLRQMDQRRVDNGFPMRMVIAGRVAGNVGALPVLPVGRQTQIVHRHKNAPLRRLQPVPNIGQRPVHQRAH